MPTGAREPEDLKAAAVALFKVTGVPNVRVDTGALRRRAEVDASDRWIIAYDDDGRLWAMPLPFASN